MNAFERDGFEVEVNCFDPYDLEYFYDDLRRLESAFFGRNRGELYDAIHHLPTFLRLISSVEMRQRANYFLGSGINDPLYAHANRVLMQPPGDDSHAYGWHSERFYGIPNSRFVQTWFPLVEDATVELGTIEVAVGSHREMNPAQTWTEAPGRSTQIIVDPAVVAKYETRQVEMKLGSCLFFDGNLVHRSGKNTSNRTRYSGVGMYCDPGHAGFRAPAIEYRYRDLTPREYFDKVNK